jgi:hypothetical protein
MEKDLRNGQRWDDSPRGPDREGKPVRAKKAAKDALKVLTKQLAKEEKDPREYGYEGEMAKSQLKGILQHAKQLHDMLKPNTDLPEWVQSKITLAYDYIQTATDYMSTEMNEEAAANAVGGGNIAAVGIDHPNRPGSGEPGVSPRAVKRYRNNNASQAPTVGRKTFTQFMQGTR